MSFTSSIVTQTVLPPSERIKKFGLECTGPGLTDEILFKAGWIPGGEYTQKLTIRNVSGSIKKFKYKLPSSRFFSMSFPELITLSPGCFICFDVIFRPVELAVYDDSIYIKVQDSHDNGFRVPVRALLSNIVAAVPSGIDFGYCPTNQVTDMFFPIENVGEIDAPFKWDVPFPFIIEPAQGVIPVGGSVQLKVSICPVDASVYVGKSAPYFPFASTNLPTTRSPSNLFHWRWSHRCYHSAPTAVDKVQRYWQVRVSDPLGEHGRLQHRHLRRSRRPRSRSAEQERRANRVLACSIR